MISAASYRKKNKLWSRTLTEDVAQDARSIEFIKKEYPALQRSQRWALVAIYALLFSGLWFEIFVSVQVVQIGTFDLNNIDPAFFITVFSLIYAIALCGITARLLAAIAAVITILIVINTVRGLAYDVTASLAWLRGDGLIGPILLLFLTVRYSDNFAKSVNTAVISISLLICLLFYIRFFVAPDFLMVADGLVANEGRAISVRGAIILAAASGLMMNLYFKGVRRGTTCLIGSLFFALTVYLSGQGTATLCTLIILSVNFGFGAGRNLKVRVLLLGSLALCIAIVLPFKAAILDSQQSDQYTERRIGNLETRNQAWSALFGEYAQRDLLGKVLGLPGGREPEIYVRRASGVQLWDRGLHSMYVSSLSEFGGVGLGLYLLMLITSLFQIVILRRSPGRGKLYDRPLAASMVLAAITLGISYEIRGEELILLVIPMMCLAPRQAFHIATEAPAKSTQPRVLAK